MRKVIIGLLLLFLPVLVWALALGPIKTDSYLDQPFSADIALQALGQTNLDNITVKLAPQSTYEGSGVTFGDYSSDLRFKVQYNSMGKPVIHVSTVGPLNEPYVEFIILVSWPNGLLTHKYTILLDPIEMHSQFSSLKNRRTMTAAQKAQLPIPANTIPVVLGSNAGTYGPTTSKDTVWSIAHAIRPDQSVTLDQVELALFQANPSGFVNNDINQMKAGYTLQIPTINQMKAISPKEAYAQLQTLGRIAPAPAAPIQYTANGTPATNGAAPPTSMTLPANTTPGATAPDATAPQTPVKLGNGMQGIEANMILPDGSTPTSSAANSGTLQAELAVSSQAVEAAKRANEILSYQMLTIQKQNQQLQQIITNQQEQINELRAEMAELHGNKPAATPTTKPAITATTPTTAPTTATTQRPGVAPKQLPASQLQPVQKEHHHLLDFFLVLLLLWLVAVAWLFYSRWKRLHNTVQNDSVVLPPSTSSIPTIPTPSIQPTVIPAPPAAGKTTSVPAVSTPAPAAANPTATAEKPAAATTPKTGRLLQEAVSVPVVTDPLEEAEVYMAYERYRPAESVLISALAKEPNRPEVLEKLFELYTLMPDQVAYRKAMQEYREKIQALDPELWERIVEKHEEKWPTRIVKKQDAPATPEQQPATPTVADTPTASVAKSAAPIPSVTAPPTSTAAQPVAVPKPVVAPEPVVPAALVQTPTKHAPTGGFNLKLAPRESDHHDQLIAEQAKVAKEQDKNILNKMPAAESTQATTKATQTAAAVEPDTTTQTSTAAPKSSSALIDTELDLVETYIGMGDYAAAEESLQNVIDKCDPKQRERAEILLEKLKSAF